MDAETLCPVLDIVVRDESLQDTPFYMESLSEDLDEWLDYYNNERNHQGKMCCGRTPIETLEDGKGLWEEKLVT